MALEKLKLPKNRFTSLEMAMLNSPFFKGTQLAWQIVQNQWLKPSVPATTPANVSNLQSLTNNGAETSQNTSLPKQQEQVVILAQPPQPVVPQSLEEISNFKPQFEDSYKNLKMSELTKLINQIKNCVESSQKNQDLLQLLEKVVKLYSYKNFGLPEIINEEIDKGYENERNLGQAGEYTAKFLAHNKLSAFLFQLGEISKKVQQEIEALTPTKLVIEPDIHTAKTVVQAPVPQASPIPQNAQAQVPVITTPQKPNSAVQPVQTPSNQVKITSEQKRAEVKSEIMKKLEDIEQKIQNKVDNLRSVITQDIDKIDIIMSKQINMLREKVKNSNDLTNDRKDLILKHGGILDIIRWNYMYNGNGINGVKSKYISSDINLFNQVRWNYMYNGKGTSGIKARYISQEKNLISEITWDKNLSNNEKKQKYEELKGLAIGELDQICQQVISDLDNLKVQYRQEMKDLQASFEIDINSIISILQKAKES